MQVKVCAVCERTHTSTGMALKTCGLCREVHYCSPEHQRQDWPLHKQTCKGRAAKGGSGGQGVAGKGQSTKTKE